MMISNQYQIQPNFQGNLVKEGLKLPKKKFNEVAKLYAGKKDLPDLKLSGMQNNSDSSGRFFHTTSVYLGNKDIASIITGSFKRMFKDCSPKEIVKELINVTKRYAQNKELYQLKGDIKSLQAKIRNMNKQLKYTTEPVSKKSLQIICDRMEQTLKRKEEKLETLKRSLSKISGEWALD